MTLGLMSVKEVSFPLDTGNGAHAHQSVTPSPTRSPSCGTLHNTHNTEGRKEEKE